MQVQLGLGILLVVASCVARDIPTHAETVDVDGYETVFPRVIRSSRNIRNVDGADSELTVQIQTSNETLTLHLKMNEKLIAPHFTSIHYDDDGKEIITDGQVNCYYQGEVEEHPKWVVVMNTCGGLNGFFGDMNNKSQYFHLSPMARSNPTLEQAHILVTASKTANENGTCGTQGHSESETITDHLESLASDIERVRRQSPTGDYIVEVAIVNDNRQYNHHGRDLSGTVQNALDVVNAADVIFKTLRVRLVVVHVITWTSGDRINVVSDPNTLLDNIRQYRSIVTQPHDSLMLLTGRDLTQNTVGIAYLNTMCGSASVGVVQEASRSTSSSGSTFTHEMGHLFNFQHDTSGCSCNDPSGRCVMAAVSGFPSPELWSSCSVNQLQSSLTRVSNNLGRCLGNEPLTTVGDPVCGNGIREGDEVCDCGSSQECDDPCCDATTCRPAAGAQCTKGECCTSTCQFKVYGTTCRSTSGQCDIEEYCSGESSECPVDVYRQDGSSCNSNQAYCFSGECQTYNAQCQYHFTSNMGVSNCYTSYNPQGNVFGNCGYTSTDYIPCAQSDALCGQLFCEPGDYQRRVSGVSVTIVTVGVFVNGGRRDCVGFTTEPGTDMLSPGLVSDGTRCRDGHLCYEQRCIPVENLPGASCPVANGLPCSGRGKCNNRGQCSCDVGYTGSACQTVNSGSTINECATGVHNCDQGCVDTEESFFCTCDSGYRLGSDGRSCITDCGGRLTTSSGSFQTPGWPNTYPQENFQCEWIVELPNSGATIEFTIDDSAFGINGRDSCTSDHIQFFDGTGTSDALLLRLCGSHSSVTLTPITTSSSSAKVVFTGSVNADRPASRVGVKVDYTTVTTQNECQVNNGGCAHICVDTAQSFECSCNPGYSLSSDGRSCIDVNECSSNNGGCQQNCVNALGSFICTCDNGYNLQNDGRSCIDINECSQGTDNCAHQCTNSLGSFTCSCNNGFRLASDQRTCNNINECTEGSHNCEQSCTDTTGSFTCSCDSGFTLAADGRSCTADPVAPFCGGTLTAASGSFQTPGYPDSYPQEDFQCVWIIELPNNGATIEFTIDDSAFGINGRDSCTSDHIQFFDGTGTSDALLLRLCGARSSVTLTPITTSSSSARVVFTGSVNPNRPDSRVGVKVDYTTVTTQNECQVNNGGCAHICVDTAQSFECSCNPGYSLSSDGRSCIDVNECSSNNGGCQQNCVNALGSFICTCDNGYNLQNDGRSCIDINECSQGTDNCAHQCTNSLGSFTCSCNNGFRLASDQRTCNNINECTEGSHNCEQSCTDTTGSFTCSCDGEFTLAADGRSCIADPAPSLCGGTLTAASGSFQTPGYPNSYPQENFQCVWIIDVDGAEAIEFNIDDSTFGINGRPPCTNDHIEFFDGTGSNAASLEKICGVLSLVTLTPITTSSSSARVVFTGSVNPNRPASRVGVKVDYTTVTTQNECQVNNGGCAHICVDTAQSFECSCNPGYSLSSDGRSCIDVNECSSNNGGCQQNCVNTIGSFVCICNDGYSLLSDERSCVDINECSQGTDNCAHQCTNSLGSFTCSCNNGFRLAGDQRTCNNINECTEGSHNCEQRCTDTTGSFTCSCDSGFTLATDGRSCIADPVAPLCGGTLTAASGSFQTPGYPNSYPQENFQCVWIVDVAGAESIEFNIDDSAFGINGRPPCTNDHIEFFDGTGSNAASLRKTCGHSGLANLTPITTSSSSARVVFTGSVNQHRPASRVGVKVDYVTASGDVNECQVNNGGCSQICEDTPQSFECSCNSGYTLGSDGRTCTDVNECTGASNNCEQVCENSDGSFTCSCNDGFTLESDGRSCTAISVERDDVCGGILTGTSGSFQTPGYPNSYPQDDFQCVWFIILPDNQATIEFNIDDSAFGINGRPPCTNDHIEFFEGTGSNAGSLRKTCGHSGLANLTPITTSSSSARVVFTGSANRHRPASRVGVRVTYQTA